jgi:hypothetical protein
MEGPLVGLEVVGREVGSLVGSVDEIPRLSLLLPSKLIKTGFVRSELVLKEEPLLDSWAAHSMSSLE